VLAVPLVNGTMLENVILNTGATVINHMLGRKMQGWIITDIDGSAVIYRSVDFNSVSLTLTSSSKVSVNLWVF